MNSTFSAVIGVVIVTTAGGVVTGVVPLAGTMTLTCVDCGCTGGVGLSVEMTVSVSSAATSGSRTHTYVVPVTVHTSVGAGGFAPFMRSMPFTLIVTVVPATTVPVTSVVFDPAGVSIAMLVTVGFANGGAGTLAGVNTGGETMPTVWNCTAVPFTVAVVPGLPVLWSVGVFVAVKRTQ